MRTRSRALSIVIAVIVLMSAMFIASIFYEYKYSSTEIVTQHEKAVSFLLNSEFQDMKRIYSSRINGFVNTNTNVKEAFALRNREQLISLIWNRFTVIKNENPEFSDIIFFLPDGSMFLSMKDTNSYGADFSAHSYIQAMDTQDTLNGFMISGEKLFFHSVRNIYVDGQKTGIVEFRSETTSLNRKIKEILNAESALAVINSLESGGLDNSLHETVIFDRTSPLFNSLPRNLDIKTQTRLMRIKAYTVIMHSTELLDFKGDHLGYLLTLKNITDSRNRFEKMLLYIFSATFIVCIISAAVIYTGFGRMIKKVELANSHLEKQIQARTKELEEANQNALRQNLTISSLFRRFKSMFNDHHAIMLLIDPKTGYIIDANNAARQTLSSSSKEITEANIMDFSILPDEDVLVLLEKAAENGLKDYVSKFVIDGRILNMELQISPIEIDRQKLLFTICYDVTEKTRMLDELTAKKETELRNTNECLLAQQSKMTSVGEVLSAIIHQWKQPITALSYLLQDITDAAERGNTDKEYIISSSSEALAQINYMTQTIDDFKNFLIPGKHKQHYNIADCIFQTVKILQKQLEKENIALHLTMINEKRDTAYYSLSEIGQTAMSGIDYTCFDSYGFPNEFKQVLLNIICNAKDALKANQNISNEEVNIICSCENDAVEINITDNAGGIDEAIIDKVFLPYFSTKPEQGTGIGLYMAKNIIEGHMNGSIRAGNKNDGAIFTVLLKKEAIISD